MSSADAYDTIRTKLVDDLGATYPIIDFEDTEATLGQSDAAFLALEEDYADEAPISFGDPGNNRFREEGSLRVHVFAPSKGGMGPCRSISESVRDSLRSQNLSAGSGRLQTGAASPPLPGAINDGLWSSQIVNVDYSFDIFR